MRSSAGVVAGTSRSASPNQCAAVAGASRTASSPASRRTAAAPTSPSRADRSTWWARAEAVAPRAASAAARALVGRHAPAGRGRLVDRAPNDRMPEPEAARHVGRADEIEPEQLVDRRPSPPLGHRRPRPRPARARRGRPPPPLRRGRGDAGRDSSASSSRARRRRSTARRSPRVSSRRAPPCRDGRVGRPRELLEVEGVAAALLVEVVRVAARRPRRPGAHAASRALSARSSIRVRRSHARPARARSTAAPARGAGRMARARSTGAAGGRRSSATEQLDRGRVGPVEVVEHEHERLRRREPLEQRRDGAVAAVALVLERQLAADRERRQRRETCAELAADVVVEGRRAAGLEPSRRTRRARPRRRRRAGRARARRRSPRGRGAPSVGAGRRPRPGDVSCRCPARRRAASLSGGPGRRRPDPDRAN